MGFHINAFHCMPFSEMPLVYALILISEISQGQVLFSQNPLLCYVDTIDWDLIATESFFPVMMAKKGTKKHCKYQA